MFVFNAFEKPKQKTKKSYDCPRCHAIFDQKMKLEHHLEQVHETIKPYKCSMCNAKFGQVKLLEAHICNFAAIVKS